MTTPTKTFWRDTHGRVVIFQPPNPPIILWAAGTIVARVVATGPAHSLATFIAAAALFTWAYLELTQGTTRARQLLGLIVLVGIVITHLQKP